VLEALLGLAALNAGEHRTESGLKLLLAVLQHPASTEQMRARAERLRLALWEEVPPTRLQTIAVRSRETSLDMLVRDTLANTSAAIPATVSDTSGERR
jgi:hypothetical protein